MQDFRVQRKQEFRVNRKAVEGGHGWRERGMVKSLWLGRGQSEEGEPAFSPTHSPPPALPGGSGRQDPPVKQDSGRLARVVLAGQTFGGRGGMAMRERN